MRRGKVRGWGESDVKTSDSDRRTAPLEALAWDHRVAKEGLSWVKGLTKDQEAGRKRGDWRE